MIRSRSMMVMFTPALLGLICLWVAGCGKPKVETIEIEPATATLTVGQTQQWQATGRDAKGRPLDKLTFTWTVAGESGRIDANGLFTAVKAGQATVTAAAEGVEGSVSVTVTPEPVAKLVTAVTPEVVVAGESAQLSVTAQNAAGQGIADIEVQVQAETPDLTLDKAAATTGTAGQATFTLTMPPQVQANRVRVSAGEQRTTVEVQSQSGAPTAVQITVEPSQVVAGDTSEIQVTVRDQHDNPVSDTAVRFTSTSADTTVSPGEVSTNDQGVASSQVQTGPTAGVNRVEVQVAELAPQTVEVVGQVGAPALLTIRTAATETIASASVPITVLVNDRYGNPVPDIPVQFEVSPDTAALDATTATTDATGMAPVTLRTSQEPGNNTVRARVANLEAIAIVVLGHPPVALRVIPPTATIDMLGTQQFRATAEDAAGHTVEVTPTWNVSGGNGTIDAQGNLTASGLGDDLVLAAYAGLTSGSQITVVPGAVASVEVTPQDATVTAGTNHQFQAKVFNAHRYALDVVPTWDVTGELGTIDASGLLTATKAGQGSIVATAQGQTGRAAVTVVPGALATLRVEPEQLHMRAGESMQLRVQGFDAVGNEVAIEPSWRLNAALGELEPTGVFHARRAGMGSVQVTVGPIPIVRDIPVQVDAAQLTRIEVEPRTLTLAAGVEHTFSARGYDAYDNPIEVTPTWQVTEDIGDINAKGSFLARRTGSAQIRATVDEITGEASVTVKPSDLARLTVQPSGPLTLTAGTTVSLTITGYDAFGNTVAVTPTWTQTTPLGTLSAEGFFRAEKVGSGRLMARSDEETVSVAVTILAGKLAKVAVTPMAAAPQAGNLVTFSAQGFDAYDNEVPITPTWRVTESIGEITADGVFTALQARSGEMIATAQGITGSAKVTVAPGALTLLNVTPTQLALTAGETAEILVVGYDAHGNPVPIQPVWHVSDGMGTVMGNTLTAQKAGTGRVVVAVGHLAAVVDLQVHRGEVATLKITPASAQVRSGEQQAFTVTGFDRGGNAIPVETAWDVQGEGGTITAEGVFTATQAGKSRIQAHMEALTGAAEVTVVPGVAATLQVAPETISLVAGQSQALRSEAFDAAGNQVQTSPAWSVQGGVGSVSSQGVFTATGAGTGKIVATLDEQSQAVEVEVTPGPLATIAVSPWKLLIKAGETQSFSATGYDAYGNAVVVQPTWSVQGGIGQIDGAQGDFKATTVGSGAVIAVVETVAGLAPVTVEPGPVAQLQIQPSQPTVAAGNTVSFQVTAFDAFHNPSTTEVDWAVEAPLGRIESGTLMAEKAGTTEVVARSGEVQAAATVHIQPGVATRLQIVPRQVDIPAGTTVQLRALGFDADDNMRQVPVTWELSGNVGTLTDSGEFTAGPQGKGQITARLNALSDSVPVTTMPGPVQRLVMRPEHAQVASTMSQDFTIIGLDVAGNEQPVDVRWALSANIGQLNKTGQFVGTYTGQGTVVAYTPTALRTAEVTVQPGPVALLFVKPQPVTTPAGAPVEFHVQAFDAFQNAIPSFQPHWSVTGNIGTIDPQTGVFTGTSVGRGKILAKVDSQHGSADVVIRPGTPDAEKSRLVASRLTVPADGKTSAEVIIHVQDRYGNPITQAQVTLISNREDQIDQPAPTNQDGVAFGRIRSVRPGQSEIRAVIESKPISNPLHLTFQGFGASG